MLNTNSSLHAWLTHQESFMDRLKKFGITDAKIKILNQTWSQPHEEESHSLDLKQDSHAFLREVLIHSQTYHWMYARTVVPSETLTDEEIKLTQLENTPLGTILFANKQWQRQEFEFAYITKNNFWFNKVLQHLTLTVNGLWARRSLFYLREKKLLLTEIFLPDLENLT